MIKWELKEKYDQQAGRHKETETKYRQAVIDAGTHLADLKAEVEALVRKEVSTGEDLSRSKDRLREKIAATEKALVTAQEEERVALDQIRSLDVADRVTIRDLVVDWNGPYCRKIREIELQPIIDRMRAARDEYLNAALDYYELIDEYMPTKTEVARMEYEDARPGDQFAVHDVATVSMLPIVTNDELYGISDHRNLPTGVSRKSIKEVK